MFAPHSKEIRGFAQCINVHQATPDKFNGIKCISLFDPSIL